MRVETTHASAVATSTREKGIILTLLIATFVVILNETIMGVALPRLKDEFQVEASTVQWLTTAYLLVMAVLIPTTGFLIQRFSTRTLFLTAMGLFTMGTVAAAAAPGFEVLLVGRVFQAAGTALMLPLLMTVILVLVPMERRGAMMSTASMVISVAPAIGPALSGLIIQALSWRFMFIFVIPIALAVLAYGYLRLVNVGKLQAASLDRTSILLAAIGFGGLVYGFSRAGEPGSSLTEPIVLAAIGMGLVGIALFAWRQTRLSSPLLDLRVFRFPMFSLSVVLMMVVMVTLFASAILLPFYFQQIRQFNTLQTGLFLLPGGALMGFSGLFVGRIFDRSGPRMLVMGGMVLVVVALWQWTFLNATTSVIWLLSLHVIFSLGLACLFTPILTTGLNQLPQALHSHGTAISNTLQQVAGAIGTALLITIMSAGQAQPAQTVAPNPLADLTVGIQNAFVVAAGIAVVGLVLALFLRRTGEPTGEPTFIH
ncbi:MAG: DHA2 family efflux MFS transporter permease subunit [Chloroflexi bacterium]|nr:DHA2 family efflux MFS transporter permease subunit [Chloroflexota bacterium]